MNEPVMTYPGPRPSPLTRPFWTAAAAHRLTIQRCAACGAHVFYPRQRCPACWSNEMKWVDVCGDGVIASFVGAYKPGHPAFVTDAPYVIALVDLAEGARLLTNIVDVSPDEALIGRSVTVTFVDRGDTTLPLFRLVGAPR